MRHRNVLIPSIDVTKAEGTATFYMMSVSERYWQRVTKKRLQESLKGNDVWQFAHYLPSFSILKGREMNAGLVLSIFMLFSSVYLLGLKA
jgi:hypothetical protein